MVSPSTPDRQAKDGARPHDGGWAALVADQARASIATVTGGLSPSSLGEAFTDWATHLALSPASQMQLAVETARECMSVVGYSWRTSPSTDLAQTHIGPPGRDSRFDDASWASWPFNLIYQSYLLSGQWWDEAGCDVLGVLSLIHI